MPLLFAISWSSLPRTAKLNVAPLSRTNFITSACSSVSSRISMSLVVVAAFGDTASVPLPDGTYEVAWSTPTPVRLGTGSVEVPRHAGAVLRRL